MTSLHKSTGRDWPASPIARRLHKRWDRSRESSVREIEVADGPHRYRFVCGNLREYARCAGLFLKEPGTCAWIEEHVRPGDTFFDVGANIGIYSIMAAARVGSEGHVYAFEPHAGNFDSLARNIAANRFTDVITPCSFALHNQVGYFEFNYASLVTGSSSSQLEATAVPGRGAFEPVVRELKRAETIDGLIEDGLVGPPSHIKIDVDGNEALIVAGMQRLLSSDARPRTISVEINVGEDDAVGGPIERSGYRIADRNLSRTGAKKKKKNPDEPYVFNAIFVRSDL